MVTVTAVGELCCWWASGCPPLLTLQGLAASELLCVYRPPVSAIWGQVGLWESFTACAVWHDCVQNFLNR